MNFLSAKTAFRDLAGITGAGLVAYGAWLIYVPSGYVVAGAMLLAGVWLAARADA